MMKPTSDTPVVGTLLLFIQNAALAEGVSVDGSVVILCCNLIMEADVKGNVTISTGNVFKQRI